MSQSSQGAPPEKPAPVSNSKRDQLAPEDFYYTPQGFLVFTEAYHLKRGYCCKSGCRHCPYGNAKKETIR